MQKLIVRVALFRRGVEQFEEEVNAHLLQGWKVYQISIVKQGLRIICTAVVDKREPVAELT